MTTDFQQAVYDAVRAIPRGEVRTYGDIADEVGSTGGGIAVGQALLPLDFDGGVPFWRVVLAGGEVNTAAAEAERPEALARVRRVLAEEGVAFTNDGRVASIAARGNTSGSGGGARSTKTKSVREAEPCGKHITVQWTCRDCAPPSR